MIYELYKARIKNKKIDAINIGCDGKSIKRIYLDLSSFDNWIKEKVKLNKKVIFEWR